ncbi:conserved repeat domain-containing protein [Thiothrix caldifontis]|uniref:Conserved repeat domain-containing protein n=1 Tax=Thiothrix caldifontis TaxID=525918 RepID=A0A1H4GS25_9GAMM|nr:DUF11 domain-containing protein [Thiothrix caldifontis]SEB12334.1 conserved repeat domain-containing protein [Thiothrix caldifontis]
MRKLTNTKALLMSFCAIGVLMAANQSWADSTITNCAQVSATVEQDTDSSPANKASQADLLTAFTGGTLEDDEACAPLTVQSIFDLGDAPTSYGTDGATAAKHEIVPGLMLGGTVDEEADGQPTPEADGDGADEDGYSVPVLTDGQAVTLKVTATNTTDKAATLGCWIDYNGNGTFDETEYGGAPVAIGAAGSIIDVVMPAAPADASTTLKDGTYARCRLSTDTIDGTKATGALVDGEVEDTKVTFTAQPVFDLALVKRLAAEQAASVKPGDTVKFTIEVTNQGNIDAKDIAVTDYIPTGLTLADANWTAAAGVATLNTPIPALAKGDKTTVEISFTVNTDATAGTIQNAAEISAVTDSVGAAVTDVDSTPDTNSANETGIVDDVIDNTDGDEDDHDIAEITITVDPKVDIELVKTVTDEAGAAVTTVRRGDTVIYVLTATNKGPDNATGVTVTDQLPSTLTYVSDDSAGNYVSATGQWTVGDLANGANKVLKITATVK